MHSVGRDSGSFVKDSGAAAQPRTRSSSPATVDANGSGGASLTPGTEESKNTVSPASMAAKVAKDGEGNSGGVIATEADGSRGDGLVGPSKSAKGGGRGGYNTREAGGGKAGADGDEDLDAGDWSTLPMEFLAADLSKIFRASQEKVEETLTAGCFYL